VVKQTAIGIEENFARVARELELLANIFVVESIDLYLVHGVLAETFDHVRKHQVGD
jgi:predicted aldo/keto reductase-like oxidoreductase